MCNEVQKENVSRSLAKKFSERYPRKEAQYFGKTDARRNKDVSAGILMGFGFRTAHSVRSFFVRKKDGLLSSY